MTLILTEVTSAGVAMAADSAISYFNPNGTISHIDHKGWRKVLWVPRIWAGVSYWGFVGQATRQRFDEWLDGGHQNGHQTARKSSSGVTKD